MQAEPATQQPLLTIAIPTFNRAQYLEALLNVLRPQAAAFPGEVEVLVSDNASEDNTPEVTAREQKLFDDSGAQLRVVRHPSNIGSDANFAACFRAAQGRFFWMCGDDDILVPGALSEVMPLLRSTPDLDMVYATSYGFREDFERERQGDPMGRTLHTIRDARQFALTVNIMFSFISGVIVNKQRLMTLEHACPETFVGSNLVQLSWSLPLLLHHRTSIALWTRPVAARIGNAHGYAVGKVFGDKLAANVRCLLPGREDLQSAILNPALRRWFPSVLLDLRADGNTTLAIEQAHNDLAKTFGNNLRYWFFTWPALAWPMPAAKLWTKGTAALSKAIYMAHLPGFWRKRT